MDKVTTGNEYPEDKTIDHTFCVRMGFRICIKLPEDLTANEAERLAEFVKCLPFVSED